MSTINPKLLLVGADSTFAAGLSPEAFVLTRAESLPTALERLKSESFDLILLDLAVSEEGGLSAFHQLQTSAGAVPMLVLGASAEDGVKAVSLGAQEALLKADLTETALAFAVCKVLARHARHPVYSQEGFLLKALMDNIPDSVYFKDVNSRFLMISRAKAQKHQLKSPEEALGKSDADFFTRPHAQKALADELEIMCTGKAIEAAEECLTWPDGRLTWSSTTKMPLRDPEGRIVGTFGVSRDITEQKQASRDLANERVILRLLMDSLPACVYLKDINARKTMANPMDVQNLGYQKESDVIGKTDFDCFPPEEAAAFYADDMRVIQTGEPILSREEKLTRPDGSVYWLMTSKVPLRDSEGRIIGLAGVGLDITAQKQALFDLANERKVLRHLVDSLPMGVYLKDTAARKTLANPVDLYNLGFTKESEVIGKTDFDSFPPEQAAAFYADDMRVLQTGEPLLNREEQLTRSDGTKAWVLTSKVPLRDTDGRITGLAGFGVDITERKRVEELQSQLRQAQKLESIGQLAGGVAHDFNNILAVIQLLAGLLKADKELQEKHRKHALEIEEAAERAANLTRQLLQFSRKQAMKQRSLNLTEVATSIYNMLQRILGGQIQMQFKFAPQALLVQADESMLEQVMMNLAVNARDAMPKGGLLVIETSAVEFDEVTAAQTPEGRPGEFACLSVSDTGCGIAPEVLPKIFEPFFTTKEVGKGSGLGLAAVFGIIREHNGWTKVYSEVGKGTSFRVYLPRVPELTVEKSLEPNKGLMRGGNETILLVEDDAAVRTTLRTTLVRLGYRVLEASAGAEALGIWKKHQAEISLLLTDLMMPGGMNGMDVARALTRENPKLKVIYASGYSVEIASQDQEVVLKDGVNFLPKPFDSRKLAQTLRKAFTDI